MVAPSGNTMLLEVFTIGSSQHGSSRIGQFGNQYLTR